MSAHTANENRHPDNALWRGLTQPPVPAQDIARDQTEAVANAIGCPEWTKPDGCDSRNRDPRAECFCATAARAVVQIERLAGSAS